jgi:hypothetical protein
VCPTVSCRPVLSRLYPEFRSEGVESPMWLCSAFRFPPVPHRVLCDNESRMPQLDEANQ